MESNNMKFTQINMATYKGGIPFGSELAIAESVRGEADLDSAMVLYGFDEVDDYAPEFKNPVVGIITL